MPQTKARKNIVPVKLYYRKPAGECRKTISVRGHRRSTSI